MKAAFVALFLALVAMVTAQSSSTGAFYVTNPLPGTSFKAGDSVDLTWNNGLDQTVKVIVIQGANSNTMSPTGITFDVQGADGSFEWKVPNSLAPTGTYAFQFQYKDDNGSTQYAYSGPISVSGGTGTLPSVSATPTSAATSASVSASSVVSSVTPSSSAVSSASSSAPTSSASSVSSSASASKSSASASATPTPNSASGLKVTSLLAVPALIMAALYA